MVLVHHFTIYGIPRPAAGLARVAYRVAQAGWIGVDLFFVLSGFLITSILLRTKSRDGYFRTFYARRVRRIAPLYFGFLAVTIGVLPRLFPDSVRLHGWAGEGLWYSSFLGNVMIALHGWSPDPVQGLNHFWSLAVEEQFYLFWPVVVFSVSGRGLAIVCIAMSALSFAARGVLHVHGLELAAYSMMPARLDALSAGALVAVAAARVSPDQLARAGRWAAAAGAAGLALIVARRHTLNPNDPMIQTAGYLLIAVTFAGVIALAVAYRDSIAARWLGVAPLRVLAPYSYSLYVFHHPILFAVPIPWVAGLLLPFAGSVLLSRSLAIVLVFALCMTLSLASWHLYERPILQWRSKGRSAATAARPVGGAAARPAWRPETSLNWSLSEFRGRTRSIVRSRAWRRW
jgi:peptidoglycan/LPS O-acetylase OafA/YrhL